MDIVMPKLGLTMTEGTLTEWLKEEGDFIRQGDILFLFESEKATMEFESPAGGVVGALLVSPGTTVECGTSVASLIIEGASEVTPPTAPHISDSVDSPTVGGASTVGVSRPAADSARPADVVATPAAKRLARELDVALRDVSGRGPNGRIHVADVEQFAKQQISETGIATAVEMTPVARRLAEDVGLDLQQVSGTGTAGWITRNDVIAAIRVGLVSPASTMARVQPPTYERRKPLTGMRAVIARRMSESAFTAPHVTLHTDGDATALVAARQQINAELDDGSANISYNAFLVALVARALREHPMLNACLVEEEILIYGTVNIALAIDTERGLVVPVIRDADRLSLIDIQNTADVLIQRALSGTSLPDDFSDGTFTITNLGMFDIDGFTPIINQPQSAILGVGRIVSTPVDAGGTVAFRERMTLSLSFDHRIVDGGPAARFLQRVKQLIERPFALALTTERSKSER